MLNVGANENSEKNGLDIASLVAVSRRYWTQPTLPDPNVWFADKHWDVINKIIPSYDKFVSMGTNLNRSLKAEFDVSYGLVNGVCETFIFYSY